MSKGPATVVGDLRRWPSAIQVADECDFAPGITRDPKRIAYRSLALSNGTCKCDRRGRIRTGRHLRFHLSFFAWRRPSVPARSPGRVSRSSSRISSAGRVNRLPLTCCRSGIETCKSHWDDPMLQQILRRHGGLLRMTVSPKVWAQRFANGYRNACHSERSRRISRLLDWTCSTCHLKTNLCADAWPAFRPPLDDIRATM